MALGWQEFLVLFILAALYFVPIAAVWYIARRSGRSLHFVWWPVVLGWVGAVIALVMLHRTRAA